MEIAQLQTKLEGMGVWKPYFKLEPLELLAEYAPENTLSGLACFYLVNTKFAPALDGDNRDWMPVVILNDVVLAGPSPLMFEQVIRFILYFERPTEFGELLLRQLHSFTIDYFEGYQVREDSILYEGGTLFVRGRAYREKGTGIWEGHFVTRLNAQAVAPDHVTFELSA